MTDSDSPSPSDSPSTPPPGKPPRTWRIHVNAPFVLGFGALSLFAMLLGAATQGGTTRAFFSLPGTFDLLNVLFYPRLVLHAVGHADWAHFFANFTLILLVGPLLEEKYGSWNLGLFAAATAGITGFLHTLFFNSPILGASGVVFMMILLTSLVNMKRGTVPLTFILVSLLYLGNQIARIFQEDRVSQFAHILGGLCGAGLGFWWEYYRKPGPAEPSRGS